MAYTSYSVVVSLIAWESRGDLSRVPFRIHTFKYKVCFDDLRVGWLVVLGFNATLTAKVISWRSVTHMCFLPFSHQYQHNFSFQSHQLLFSHASTEVRGENAPERKVTSTGDRTHNHQVMSPTRSPLSHPGGACFDEDPAKFSFWEAS